MKIDPALVELVLEPGDDGPGGDRAARAKAGSGMAATATRARIASRRRTCSSS